MEHNEPIILRHEKLPNNGSDERFPADWRGSLVQVTIEGNYSAGQGQAYRVSFSPYEPVLIECLCRFLCIDDRICPTLPLLPHIAFVAPHCLCCPTLPLLPHIAFVAIG